MRHRSTDLLLAAGCLLSLAVAIFLGHRDRLAAAAQQKRQAAANACSAQVLAAIQQTGACQAADPTRALMDQNLELSREANRLVEEQLTLNRQSSDWRRAHRSGLNSIAWRDLQANATAHQIVLDDVVRRSTDASKASQGPINAHLAAMTRLNGNSMRLLARQAQLTAAMTAGYRAPSRLRPWAILLASLLSLAWTIRVLWFRRQHVRRLRDHRCVACDYDLRASPDRCPECGTARLTVSRATV